MIKKIYFKIFSTFLILMLLCSSISIATVSVTEDNLNDALYAIQTYLKDSSEYELGIIDTASDDSFTLSVNDIECKVEYDLTDSPTFTYELPIYQGMSYSNYTNQIENLTYLPALEFMAVCYIEGIDFPDSEYYFLLMLLAQAFSSSSSSSYTIYDDTDISDGVTITSDDDSILYVSEFDDWIIDYTNSVYGEDSIFSDSSDGYDLYTLTISEKDLTETSCTLVSTLTMNMDGYFSQLDGISEALTNSTIDTSNYDIDYTVQLTEGQKCILEASEELHGFELVAADSGSVSISSDYTCITAVSAGTIIYNFYIGDNTYVICFIISEASDDGVDNSAITLKIGSDNNNITNQTSNESSVTQTSSISSSYSSDNSTSTSKLPSTGLSLKLIYLIILVNIILLFILKIKYEKYKDVK